MYKILLQNEFPLDLSRARKEDDKTTFLRGLISVTQVYRSMFICIFSILLCVDILEDSTKNLHVRLINTVLHIPKGGSYIFTCEDFPSLYVDKITYTK
jgi:hypothetical protein